jgi:leukotriene-A4 hydrolase
LAGVDPDDAFSGIPYEKGMNFLYFLESLMGSEKFEAFMKDWIQEVCPEKKNSTKLKNWEI